MAQKPERLALECTSRLILFQYTTTMKSMSNKSSREIVTLNYTLDNTQPNSVFSKLGYKFDTFHVFYKWLFTGLKFYTCIHTLAIWEHSELCNLKMNTFNSSHCFKPSALVSWESRPRVNGPMSVHVKTKSALVKFFIFTCTDFYGDDNLVCTFFFFSYVDGSPP